MGIFKKKEDRLFRKAVNNSDMLPEIPPLPRLPELPEFGEDEFSPVHPLPKLPNDSLGKKFSQNVIKDAVTGKKEVPVFADEFAESGDEMQMMQRPMARSPNFPMEKMSRELPTTPRFEEKRNENEPVFVRLDKFEDGINALDTAKKQISEVEKTLREIRKLKEEEEKELSFWERQVGIAREQVEKIDRDIFSKISQ